jgi:1-deoxy-D-xylulose-5-phosphate reductoisomerase
MCGLVESAGADIVVVATPGLVALSACLVALRQGKLVAIANKEMLVTAGAFVMETARAHGGTIVPVDSEHNAIWQCLRGEDPRAVVEIVLTSSGGALRDLPLEELASVTPERALQHPTWSMGPKITVDSATLMNKGLEIIEASLLFDVSPAMVSVVLHRQSIVHALVEYADGSLKAQLAVPDMRIPILNALTYPERAAAELPRLDIAHLGALTFEPVDAGGRPRVRARRTPRSSTRRTRWPSRDFSNVKYASPTSSRWSRVPWNGIISLDMVLTRSSQQTPGRGTTAPSSPRGNPEGARLPDPQGLASRLTVSH